MEKTFSGGHPIDYVEIYTPQAKALAYWHKHALGFAVDAVLDIDSGHPGVASYALSSGDVRLVLTAAYPHGQARAGGDIDAFIARNYCGVKRIALRVPSVPEAFARSLAGGAVPVCFPTTSEDEHGRVVEAAIRLYDCNEIAFVDRSAYAGAFRPGYRAAPGGPRSRTPLLHAFDHVASEVRINESARWTAYLTDTIGTAFVQGIERSADNNTGMLLKVSQSADKNLTLVIAEPESASGKSKVQKNIDAYGAGIHHLAFSTRDMVETVRQLSERDVDFVRFPDAYYELLRANSDFADMDIDTLQQHGILVDKENDSFLLQKFLKPISDRPFFLYEIVQRVNGYNGFALKNINVLKRAEEMHIMKAG